MSRDPTSLNLSGWLTSVALTNHRAYLLSVFERDSFRLRELLAVGVTAKALWEAFAANSPTLRGISLWTFREALADWRKAHGLTRLELRPTGLLPSPSRSIPPPPAAAPPALRQAEAKTPMSGRPVAELHADFLNQVILPAVQEGKDPSGLSGLPHVNPEAAELYQRPAHPMERQLREAEELRLRGEAAATRRLTGD